MINKSMTPREWALLCFLSLLWGASFLFTAVAVREVPPLTLVFLRVALAASTLWIVHALSGRSLPHDLRQVWRSFTVMGVLNNAIPFVLIFWAQIHIPAGLASILNGATPIFTVVVAHFLTTDERLTPQRIAGVVAGLIGIIVMVGADALVSLGVHVAAEIAMLLACVSYSFATPFGRRFSTLGIPPLASAAGQSTIAAILLAPLALVFEAPWTIPTPSGVAIAAVLASALLATALAFAIYFWLLETAGAANVASVTFLIPISAIVLGAVVLGERLEPRHFAGMALIGLGLAAIDGRLLRRLRSRRA